MEIYTVAYVNLPVTKATNCQVVLLLNARKMDSGKEQRHARVRVVQKRFIFLLFCSFILKENNCA